MTKIAFTADLHCDEYGSRIDPATGLNARWVDTVDMARWVATDARRRDAEVLVVAGDFTEARHPAPWRVAQIGEALAEFAGPALFARGNHDGTRGGHSIVELLAARMDAVDVPGRYSFGIGFDVPDVRLINDVTIAVIPYLDAHHLRALEGFETLPAAEVSAALGDAFLSIARGLYARAKEAEPEAAAVLVVHQALSGGLMSDSQAAFLGDQGLVVDTRALAAIGFEAILAGHFHKHQVLATEPLVVYAGSPYRTDFGEEHQEKGYLVVDVEPGRATFDFVATPARRFVTVDAQNWPQAPADIGGPESAFLEDAIVRVINVPAEDNPADVRRTLEELGAFEVTEIRQLRPDGPAIEGGGMAEGLTTHEALEAYFAGDEDEEQLVERGRGILAEVAS